MKVLMCAPTHYDVLYEINPWMNLRDRINPVRARRQWKNLVAILRRLGVHVQTVRQSRGCPDMVFTANAGVVRGREFIPSHFRFQERRLEEPGFSRYFKHLGYRIRDAAKGMYFEGEGDLLPYRDMLFGGYRFRSEIRAHKHVSAVQKKRLVGLDLIQPHFYHLDTCFLPLDDEAALYYPGAFNAEGRRMIRRFVRRPIAVSSDDAHRFACNGIRVGRSVVLNRASNPLKAALRAVGYQVVEAPMTEFMKAGGSVKCLLLKL